MSNNSQHPVWHDDCPLARKKEKDLYNLYLSQEHSRSKKIMLSSLHYHLGI